MTLVTTLKEKQEIQALRAAVTRLGYETGYYGLPESPEYIDKHVRLIAHNLYGQHMPPATLQSEVERVEASMTEAVAIANARRAQVELQPALVPTLRWSRVASVCAVTYLVGELLQFTMGTMTAREWLTLCVAMALATAPWVLGLPLIAGCHSRWAAWNAAKNARQLRRQAANKRRDLERAVAQADCMERWIVQTVCALEQDYKVALEPSKKARELMAQLDSVTPPTIEMKSPPAPGPESSATHLNGTARPFTFTDEPALV